MKRRLATFGIALTLVASASMAEDGPHDAAIEARQAMFQLYGYHFGILSDMAKEKRDYDAALAAEAADNLDAVTRLGQGSFWPQGSDSETDGNARNRALPAIWSDYPDIEEKAAALKEASEALVSAAGTDLDALQGAIGPVGNACKGCHDDYRAERK